MFEVKNGNYKTYAKTEKRSLTSKGLIILSLIIVER